MTRRGLRRFIEDLLTGRRPTPFQADHLDAAQLRAAIDMLAARPGADEPNPEFLDNLHSRLAARATHGEGAAPERPAGNTRRQVIIGTSAAAATAAVAAVAVDRTVARPKPSPPQADTELVPTDGVWRPVAAAAEVGTDGMTRFEQDSLIGFVRRVDGRLEAVSGVCTHQGCQLRFDRADDRLRCPCHSTSFAPDGQLLTHQLPVAPKPLPQLAVREVDGVVEVLGPRST